MESPEEPFDRAKAIASLVRDTPERAGRKLSLHMQCEAFACLRNRMDATVVAQAFAISRSCVVQISECLTGSRYARVKAEFERLGAEHFEEHYLTKELLVRLAKVKYDVDDERTRFVRGAPTPKADRKSFNVIGIFEIDPGEFWRVTWLTFAEHPEANGWYFSNCDIDGKKPLNGWNWHGKESMAVGILTGEEPYIPFRTSGQAFAGAYAYCQRKPPK